MKSNCSIDVPTITRDQIVMYLCQQLQETKGCYIRVNNYMRPNNTISLDSYTKFEHCNSCNGWDVDGVIINFVKGHSCIGSIFYM